MHAMQCTNCVHVYAMFMYARDAFLCCVHCMHAHAICEFDVYIYAKVNASMVHACMHNMHICTKCTRIKIPDAAAMHQPSWFMAHGASPCRSMLKQRATSNEATSSEQRVTSNKQRATSSEQRAASLYTYGTEQRTTGCGDPRTISLCRL